MVVYNAIFSGHLPTCLPLFSLSSQVGSLRFGARYSLGPSGLNPLHIADAMSFIKCPKMLEHNAHGTFYIYKIR
jgi:hypothetical protein